MGYFVHLPFSESDLRPDERIVCTNATVVVDGKGQFSFWVDNNGLIPHYVEGKLNEEG